MITVVSRERVELDGAGGGMPPLRRRRPGLAAIGVLVLTALGFGLGLRLSGSGEGDPPSLLDEHDALALVLGQTRTQDSMTYGEWYRARMRKLVPGIRYHYFVNGQGPYAGEGERFDVMALLDDAPDLDRAIEVMSRHKGVASVWQLSGDVEAPPPMSFTSTPNGYSGSARIETDDDGNLVPSPPAKGTWLDEFRAGASP